MYTCIGMPHLVVPGLVHEVRPDIIAEEHLVGCVDAVGAPESALLPLDHLSHHHHHYHHCHHHLLHLGRVHWLAGDVATDLVWQ